MDDLTRLVEQADYNMRTERMRSKDRRKHTQSGFFEAGTSDDVLLHYVCKVAFRGRKVT
jgi:hypothetical protein